MYLARQASFLVFCLWGTAAAIGRSSNSGGDHHHRVMRTTPEDSEFYGGKLQDEDQDPKQRLAEAKSGEDRELAKWLEPRFQFLTSQEKMPDPIPRHGSLLIGINSAPEWTELRSAIRRTWMESPCINKSELASGFVTPRFMIEKSAQAELKDEEEAEGDIAFVDADRVAVKPLRWMQYAAATLDKLEEDERKHVYVGKMDADSIISPCSLLADLNEQKPPFYYGAMTKGYMQGGMYVLSANLAEWLRADPWADEHQPNSKKVGYEEEDLNMGRWMDRAKATNFSSMIKVSVANAEVCHSGPCEAWDPCGMPKFKHLFRRAHKVGESNGVKFKRTFPDVLDAKFSADRCTKSSSEAR